MSAEEVEDIKEMFKKIDTDNDGIVSCDDLKTGLTKFGSQLAESEVQMLIEAVSIFSIMYFLFSKLHQNLSSPVNL